MKIVHILNSDGFSGAEKVAIQIIRFLYCHGVDAYYVSLKGTIGKRLEAEGVKYYPIDKMNVKTVRKAISDLQPDIIHAHDYRTSIVCAVATRKPILSHLHNNAPWIKKYSLYSFAYLFSSVCYKKVLLVSEAILEEYVFAKWIAEKSEVIGNPFTTNEIIDKSKENIGNQRYDIVFVGRLSKPKNPFLLIEVIYELKKCNPMIRACIIGDGELREELKSKCKVLGLEKNIVWKGFLENPFPYVRQSKIFLITSSWEGYGLAAAEALALGKPVVCSKVGGLSKIINKKCGILCKDKNDLVTACKKLLEDSDFYKRMSSMALLRAKELDNGVQYMEHLQGIYRNLIEQ